MLVVKDFPRKLAHQQPYSRCIVGRCYAVLVLGLLLSAAPCLRSQTEPDSFRPAPADKRMEKQFSRAAGLTKFAAIRSLRIIQEEDGPAVEILSTKPLVPSIRTVTAPDRIVIDLPNATVETPRSGSTYKPMRSRLCVPTNFSRIRRSRAWSSICSRRAPTVGMPPETAWSCISGKIPPRRTDRPFSRRRFPA